MVETPGPHTAGGREHDVVFEPEKEHWIKYTKPGLAGYIVDWEENGRTWLRNATPLEYLARLRRQNELFQDSIELAGLWRVGRGGRRIRRGFPGEPLDGPHGILCQRSGCQTIASPGSDGGEDDGDIEKWGGLHLRSRD